MNNKTKTTTYGSGGFTGPLMYKGKPVAVPVEELTTGVMYVQVINGKCAWCGAPAKDLPVSHFEDHEKEDNKLLTVKDVAFQLSIGEETVRRYIRAGRIPAKFLSVRSIRVRQGDLNDLIESGKI